MDIPALRGIKIDTCITSFPESMGQWVKNEQILHSKLGGNYDKILRLKGQSNDLIKSKFGYELRYWVHNPWSEKDSSDSPTSLDLMLIVADKALQSSEVNKEDIDLVIAVTTTSPFYTSSLSTRVAHSLGLNCAAFDFKTGCASGLYALINGYQNIATGAKNVLIVSAETLSKVINTKTNVGYAVGDASAAVILSQTEMTERGLHIGYLGSEGKYADSFGVPGLLPPTEKSLKEQDYSMKTKIDANDTIASAWDYIPQHLLMKTGMNKDDIDLYIPHQVSDRNIMKGANSIGLEEEKVMNVLRNYGNCGSVSVFIALEKALETGKLHSGAKGMLVAVGGGLSWGGAIITP